MASLTDILVAGGLIALLGIGLWLRRHRRPAPGPQTEFDRAMADHIKRGLR